MSFTLKDGQGTLHKNDKGGVETRPDYRGEIMLDGTAYEVAGWLKDGKAGKWMSLSIKPKEQTRASTVDRSVDRSIDDDIPF